MALKWQSQGVHLSVLHEEVLVATMRWWRLEVLILSCPLLGFAGLQQGLPPEAEGQRMEHPAVVTYHYH